MLWFAGNAMNHYDFVGVLIFVGLVVELKQENKYTNNVHVHIN